MSRNLLILSMPGIVVLVCSAMVLSWCYSHDLYIYLGASNDGANMFAGYTALSVLVAAGLLIVPPLLGKKKP